MNLSSKIGGNELSNRNNSNGFQLIKKKCRVFLNTNKMFHCDFYCVHTRGFGLKYENNTYLVSYIFSNSSKKLKA